MRTLFRDITGIRLASALSDAKITELLDRAHTTIGLAAEWSFHELQDQPAVTVASTPTVSVSGVYRFDTVQHQGGAFLAQITARQYDMWPSSRKAEGKPYAWSVRGGQQLRLHPTPDAVYNLVVNGWSEPGTLSADTDTPDWPDADLHPAVPFEAASQWLEIEGDDQDRVVWIRAQAEVWFRLMFRRYNPELASLSPSRMAQIVNNEGMPPIRTPMMSMGGGEQ